MGAKDLKSKRGRIDDEETETADNFLPSGKRRRQPGPVNKPSKFHRLKDVFDYPEVFLNILSFLPAQDLVQLERVDRYWKRICNDQWLWKRIYLGKHLFNRIGF